MSNSSSAIAGRVLARDGTPAAGATVAIVGGSQPYRDIAAVTAADGAFQLSGVAPGRYRVEARSSGKKGAIDVDVAAGAPSQAEIRLDG